jgi:hypothetical protein
MTRAFEAIFATCILVLSVAAASRARVKGIGDDGSSDE